MSKLFLKGSCLALTAVAVTGVFNYLTRRFLALNLSAIDYGFFYSVLSLIMLFLSILDLGLCQSGTILMTRCLQMGKPRQANFVYSIVTLFKLAGGLFIFSILALLGPWLLDHYYHYSPQGYPVLLCLIALIVTQGLSSAPISALQAVKAFGTRYFVDMGKSMLIFVAIFLWVPQADLRATAAVYTLSALLLFIVLALTLNYRHNINLVFFRRLPLRQIKGIARLTLRVGISIGGLNAIYYMDSIMLTWFCDLQRVALYNIALPIMQILQSFMVFPAILTPIVTEMWHKDQPHEISQLCGKVIGLLLMGVWPITMFFILMGSDIITLLFSDRFVSAAPALTILCGGMLFAVMGNILINTLNACQAAGLAARCILTGVGLNLILNILLIPLFDTVGAALATLGTHLTIAITAYCIVTPKIGPLSLRLKEQLPLSLWGILGIVIAIELPKTSWPPNLVRVAVLVGLWSLPPAIYYGLRHHNKSVRLNTPKSPGD